MDKERVPPRVVDALIVEAWAAHREARYRTGLAAAERAVGLAERLDDPTLLVRALSVRAALLRSLGQYAAALVDYTRVLSLAEDPATARRLDPDRADWCIAKAYIFWPLAARFAGGVPVAGLFKVLDAADRWLAATGHLDWRSGVLSQRSAVHDWLDDRDAAIATSKEALATHRPDNPGPTVGTLQWTLGDQLRYTGRHAEAAPHYQTVLDDPTSSPGDRAGAHEGLAWCAVADQDLQAARRHATAAVRLTEPMGDDSTCTALTVLVEVCRSEHDLDGAWQAAQRHREAATHIPGHLRPYYAVRDLVDVALDRADIDTTRRLLPELERHATALDTDRATTTFADEVAERRQRLDQ